MEEHLVATIKTAISLEKPVFEEVDLLAREMEISRSRVFALAVQEFIERRKSEKMLDAINEAHDDGSDQTDDPLTRGMRRKHRAIVKDQW